MNNQSPISRRGKQGYQLRTSTYYRHELSLITTRSLANFFFQRLGPYSPPPLLSHGPCRGVQCPDIMNIKGRTIQFIRGSTLFDCSWYGHGIGFHGTPWGCRGMPWVVPWQPPRQPPWHSMVIPRNVMATPTAPQYPRHLGGG